VNDRLRRLIALGTELYTAGEYARAEGYLTQAAQEHAGFADVWNMLGVCHHHGGRFSQAEEALSRALAINPAYTEAALNLAVTCNEQGKYAEARAIYARALTRARSEPSAIDPFVRGKLANMHAELAAAYASASLQREAVREYQRALELAPTFIDLRARLAAVYRELGEDERAAEAYEEILAQNPRFVPALVSLGAVRYALGQEDAARVAWERAVSLDPGHQAAQAYLQILMAKRAARAQGHSGDDGGLS
jgi:tetratricopeptide (TPR) repeat protein